MTLGTGLSSDLEALALPTSGVLDGPAWGLYRDLLAAIPDGTVSECVAGLVWTSVLIDDRQTGLSLTMRQGLDGSSLPGSIAGIDLHTATRWMLNWNLYEASIGCAAANAVFNTRENVEGMTHRPLADFAVQGRTVFEYIAKRFAGARVAVVGRFPSLKPIIDVCDVTILERQPTGSDLPDPASEFLLGEQDCVCITGTAIANKTLPRLLELSRSAYTVLLGPSVPLSDALFERGVDLLAGAVVVDADGVRRCVREGAHRRAFREGLTTVMIAAEDVDGRGTKAHRVTRRDWHR